MAFAVMTNFWKFIKNCLPGKRNKFTWLNKQGVQSSDGFVLQRMHRFYHHYIEDDKILKIIVEACWDKDNRYFQEIITDSIIEWLPPHDGLIIDENNKKRIMKNISDALTFMGIDHKFVSR